MTQDFKFKCPHCGTINTIAISIDDNRDKIVYCDVDAGGCDQLIIIRPAWQIDCKLFVGKVDFEYYNGNDRGATLYCPTCGIHETKHGETCASCLKKTIG